MVRKSHQDGLGSASQAPRDRASRTNWTHWRTHWRTRGGAAWRNTGTRPGACDGLAWPVMAGGGVWVWSVTLTWFLLLREETQEPGLRLVTARRVMTWSGDSSVTALTWLHEWAGGVLLGNPLMPAGERGGGKWSRDAQLATLLFLRPKDWGNRSFIEVLGGGTKTKWNKSHHLLMSSLLHL